MGLLRKDEYNNKSLRRKTIMRPRTCILNKGNGDNSDGDGDGAAAREQE